MAGVTISHPRRFSRTDCAIGFIIPLGLFVEVGSPVLLAQSSIIEDGIFIPFSLGVLPIALLLAVLRRRKGPGTYSPVFIYAATSFSIYALAMSAVSALTVDSLAIIYGIQWALAFAWLPYFSTLTDRASITSFLKGFAGGVLVNVIYYSSAGIIEIITYGALQDAGRLSQNLIFIGQYQVATYLPTIVAYSLLIVIFAARTPLLQLGRVSRVVILILSLVVIAFLASRESLLVLLTFVAIMGVSRGGTASLVAVVVSSGTILLLLNAEYLVYIFDDGSLRILNKIADLSREGKIFAGRDVMIFEVMQVIDANPAFGTYFLPPNSGINMLSVNAPSAHNMYIDVLAWSGILGGCLFILAILSSIMQIIRNIRSASGRYGSSIVAFSLMLVTFLIVSNNINVPMRQPLVSPIYALLMFLCSPVVSGLLRRAGHAKS